MTRILKRLAILPALLVATTVSGCMTVPTTPTAGYPTHGTPNYKATATVVPNITPGGWQNAPVTTMPIPVVAPQPAPYTPVIQPAPSAPGSAPVLISYQD